MVVPAVPTNTSAAARSSRSARNVTSAWRASRSARFSMKAAGARRPSVAFSAPPRRCLSKARASTANPGSSRRSSPARGKGRVDGSRGASGRERGGRPRDKPAQRHRDGERVEEDRGRENNKNKGRGTTPTTVGESVATATRWTPYVRRIRRRAAAYAPAG